MEALRRELEAREAELGLLAGEQETREREEVETHRILRDLRRSENARHD
jgi:hypothetical protein